MKLVILCALLPLAICLQPFSLGDLGNFIYFTLITQTAQRTYGHVLVNADIGVSWSCMAEETGVPLENHRPWMGDHYPITCKHRESDRAAVVTSERHIFALPWPTTQV